MANLKKRFLKKLLAINSTILFLEITYLTKITLFQQLKPLYKVSKLRDKILTYLILMPVRLVVQTHRHALNVEKLRLKKLHINFIPS